MNEHVTCFKGSPKNVTTSLKFLLIPLTMSGWDGEGDFATWILERSRYSLEQERSSSETTPTLQDIQTLLKTENDRQQRELRRSQKSKSPRQPPIRALTAYGNKHYSTRPLRELKRIELSEMKWHKIHHGRYLLIRIISHPIRTNFIRFVGQDPSGLAEVVELQTTVDLLVHTGAELDMLYPRGTILAIREPYYVHCPDVDISGGIGTKKVSMIRVESPSDVVYLSPDHQLVSGLSWTASPVPLKADPAVSVSSPESAKLIGNERLKDGRLLAAERAYTQGLILNDNHTVLRLNRAHCRIKLSWFRGAFVDSEHALRGLLNIAPTSESEETRSIHLGWLQKAYHRIVLASIGLRDWTVAHKHCLAFAERFPVFPPASELLAFTTARLNEAQTGIYDWSSIYRGDRQPGGMNNTFADWVSPAFKMGYSSTSGGVRGVVADRTINAGEQLVVCKPFAWVDPKDLKEETNTVVANLLTGQLESVAQAYLTRAMVDRIKDEPRVWDVLEKLYAGPGYPDPGLVDVSTFNLPGALDSVGKLNELPNIDVSRLEGIRTYNSFAIKSVVVKETGPSTISLPSEETPSGIYLIPSLFNHACFPNVSWSFWGNLMVLRSRQVILPGEELTISYYADHPYEERTRSLRKYGIDRCDCVLCMDERLDTPAQRATRADALTDLFAYRDRLSEGRMMTEGGMYRQPRGTTAKFTSLVRSIESTYSPARSKGLMFELFAPFSVLSDVHVNEVMGGTKDHREVSLMMSLAVEWERRALESCGFQGIEPNGKGQLTSGPFAHEMVCVSAGLSIVSLLDGLGRKQDAQRWAKVVLEVHQIVFGGGKEALLVLWEGLLDSMDLLPFFK